MQLPFQREGEEGVWRRVGIFAQGTRAARASKPVVGDNGILAAFRSEWMFKYSEQIYGSPKSAMGEGLACVCARVCVHRLGICSLCQPTV